MNDNRIEEELVRERIADVLMVLSAISGGSTSERLPTSLPEQDPFGILYHGINEVVGALVEGQQQMEVYQRELEAKIETIESQRSAIRELSSPVIEVWTGVLCLPVVGVMDTARSSEMTDALLRAVTEKSARYAVIDVTGIEVMDSATADHFLRMAKAVRLLGAECVLAGVSPNIAQTIIHMGVDLSGIITYRTMREALQDHVSRGAGAVRNGRNGASKAAPEAGARDTHGAAG